MVLWVLQMGEVSTEAVTLDLLREARETVKRSPLGVINTPMIPWCQTTLPLSLNCSIHIKLENMQRTGQWKLLFDPTFSSPPLTHPDDSCANRQGPLKSEEWPISSPGDQMAATL